MFLYDRAFGGDVKSPAVTPGSGAKREVAQEDLWDLWWADVKTACLGVPIVLPRQSPQRATAPSLRQGRARSARGLRPSLTQAGVRGGGKVGDGGREGDYSSSGDQEGRGGWGGSGRAAASPPVGSWVWPDT